MNCHANRRKVLAVLLAACTCGLGVPVPPARACCSPPPAGFSVNVTPGERVSRPPEDPHGNKCRPGDGTGPAFGGSSGSVNYFNGEERFSQVDLEFAGGGGLVLRRTYRSQSDNDTAVGYGWSHGWDWELLRKPDGGVLLRTGDGNVYEFIQSGGGYQSPLGMPGDLTEDAVTGEFDYREKSGRVLHFDRRGRLASWKDTSGTGLEFSYDDRGRLPLTGTSEFVLDGSEEVLVTARKYRLTRVEEVLGSAGATGRWIELVYDDSTGRLAEAQDSAGRVVRYRHDAAGNLVQVTDVLGNDYHYEYDDVADVHNLTRAERHERGCPGCGGTTSWTFDDQDRVTEEKRFGGTIAIEYGDLEATVTVTVVDDEEEVLREDEWKYEFTANGAPTKIVEPPGHERHFVRDDSDRLTEEVFYENRGSVEEPDLVEVYRYRYSYDAAGNQVEKVITLESGEEITERWEYDSWSTMTLHERYSSADPGFIVRTEYLYDREDDGDPETEDRPLHLAALRQVYDVDRDTHESRAWYETTYEYDAAGNLVRTVHPDGRVERVEYERGLPTKRWFESDPGSYVALRYDHAGRVRGVDPGDGNWFDVECDALGRIVREVDPLGNETLYRYRRGVLVEVEEGRSGEHGGRITRFGYQEDDAPLRLVSVTAGDGTLTMHARYDSSGRILEREDGDGVATSYEYDYAGRHTKRTVAGGASWSYAYDALGRLVEVRVGEDGDLVEKVTWDVLGRRLTSEDAAGHQVRFEWNVLDRVTRYTDRRGNVTRFEYDTLGRLLRRVQPGGEQGGEAVTEWEYTAGGQLARRTDADGRVTRYTFGPWSNPLTVEYYPDAGATTPTRTVNWSWNGARRMTRVVDTAFSADTALYTWTYDAAGRVSRMESPWMGVAASYTHDGPGKVVQVEMDDASGAWSWEYEYDARGDLVEVTVSVPGGAERTVNMRHTGGGRLAEATISGGIGIALAYDAAGRLAEIRHAGGQGVTEATYRLSYDDRDRVVSREETGVGTRSFTYDSAGRLASVDYGDGTGASFTYDEEGNRVSRDGGNGQENYTYNDRNQLTAVTGAGDGSWEYDLSGRVTDLERDGTAATLSHDSEGRLTGIDGPVTARYRYDPFGRLVEAEEDGTVTRWFGEGIGPRVQLRGDGAIDEAFVSIPGIPGPFITVSSDGSGRAWLFDENLSRIRVLDLAGTTLLVEDYDPFGSHRGSGSPPAAATFRWGFGGHPRLAALDLYAAGVRGLEVATGRFLAEDPVGVGSAPELDWATYVYAASQPVGYIDPSGAEAQQVSQMMQEAARRRRRAGTARYVIAAGLLVTAGILTGGALPAILLVVPTALSLAASAHSEHVYARQLLEASRQPLNVCATKCGEECLMARRWLSQIEKGDDIEAMADLEGGAMLAVDAVAFTANMNVPGMILSFASAAMDKGAREQEKAAELSEAQAAERKACGCKGR